MLEKYKDSLPVIEPQNPFLDVTKVDYEELESYINHKLWIREKTEEGLIEKIDILISIDREKNIVSFKESNINYNDLIGIEDLNANYNENNIDFKSFVDKKAKITNKYNTAIECAIQDVDDELIIFAVRLANYETLSYDLSYPLNLIKRIKKI